MSHDTVSKGIKNKSFLCEIGIKRLFLVPLLTVYYRGLSEIEESEDEFLEEGTLEESEYEELYGGDYEFGGY